jgi:hypothetical protein
MNCPHCHREGASEPAPAPGATPASPAPTSPAPASPAPAPKRFRGARKTGWLLPGILLVLMPKCPICLAAYIALVTGISIPITAAAWLRGALIAICIGALVWLGVRCSLYLYRRAVH